MAPTRASEVLSDSPRQYCFGSENRGCIFIRRLLFLCSQRVRHWQLEAPRHRLSHKTYIREYKTRFPVSPPEDDWDARNILYSLTFNIGNIIYIPGSSSRQAVYDDMTTLCTMFCADDLRRNLKGIGNMDSENEQATEGMANDEEDGEDGAEEEEGEEEEEEKEEE